MYFREIFRNKDVLTIEQALERALFDSELIPDHNFGKFVEFIREKCEIFLRTIEKKRVEKSS